MGFEYMLRKDLKNITKKYNLFLFLHTLIFCVSCFCIFYFIFYKLNYIFVSLALFVFVLNLKIGTRNINRIENIRNCIVGYIQKTWYNENINELIIEYNKWRKKC